MPFQQRCFKQYTECYELTTISKYMILKLLVHIICNNLLCMNEELYHEIFPMNNLFVEID